MSESVAEAFLKESNIVALGMVAACLPQMSPNIHERSWREQLTQLETDHIGDETSGQRVVGFAICIDQTITFEATCHMECVGGEWTIGLIEITQAGLTRHFTCTIMKHGKRIQVIPYD